ncbi:MAG: hypothetical protein GXP10_06810 [Gammaproteobacteria bacterium]|nr:hypothetical protein [Gammaproteobacteria bacterium]
MTKTTAVILLTLSVASPFASSLAGNSASSVQLHGFISQSYTRTSNNRFFGESENNGSFDFREMGINISARPSPDLQLAAQLTSRKAGKSDDGDVQLDYGLMDYSFAANETARYGMRLGRLKVPLGLYNETRGAPMTRAGILLAQSIYFERSRNVALSADAGELYGEYRGTFGQLSAQAAVGRPNVVDPDIETALFKRNQPGRLEDDIAYSGRIMYENSASTLRAALSHLRLYIPYNAAPGDPLGNGEIRFIPWVLSMQYDSEFWTLTSEYAIRRFEYSQFAAFNDFDINGESYYIQAQYHIAPRWRALLRYDVLYNDAKDRDGHAFAANPANRGVPAYSQFAKDWAIGLRWDAHRHLMLRAEYHDINGTGWLPNNDNLIPAATQKHWNLFLLSATLYF